ncbi:UbiA family prenyltransferase [Pseudoduganella namucuonensis]|uniref:4-hydroxybenzoate polyprenyltransferase n=1 Tax=Pseudoduganella namucuonensis TaxID=1035707 RepID=A0A1I7FSP9_9BURK|nr:UbiA family prenyltransferase [Pseudoduganella namucuonensis]SFU39232.1 4-hydroxybenzoate polyprenyltransferase [Pseudoduganella namucuonensis]
MTHPIPMPQDSAIAPPSPLPPRGASRAGEPPLVVDLDGTLIYTDMLWESLLLFLKTCFWQAWRLPLWLLGGKAGFKHQIASRVQPDPATLPYDRALLADLVAQYDSGRRIVLATGSQRQLAQGIAAHLRVFDEVHATEEGVNLTSSNKAGALVRRYGARGYDYIGNSRVDIPVWDAARHAYSVTTRPFTLGDGRSTTQMGSLRGNPLAALLKAMRPRQWLKNLLVFVPMLAGHALTTATLLQSMTAFVAFSLCASSAYLLNDALDAQDDRQHPTKQKRPIASGKLPLPLAMAASPLLAMLAIGLCALFDPLLLAVLLVYFASTLGYSFYLKRILMLDIVTLSLLYTLRVLGGSAATGITPSFWLLAFSFFIFLSLALLKRFSELYNLKRRGQDKTSGRGYTVADKSPIAMMGINSAFMSVLIFMLYFNSTDVLARYHTPPLLLGIVPLLVLWLGRLWTLAFRGQVNEDPVLYVSKDPISLALIFFCCLLALAATL